MSGVGTQVPSAQTPEAQELPHAPQLLASLDMSRQTLLQTVSPGLQAQADPLQTPPVGQAVPQPPQFLVSTAGSMQAFPQRIFPEGQPHTPAVQTPPSAQWFEQAPQLFTSLKMSWHPGKARG
jgi:hypothetical protein